MGARLRLKSNVDVTQRSSDPNVQKMFRAMRKYGLIVADNRSDMYVSGTYDTRWNNDIRSAFPLRAAGQSDSCLVPRRLLRDVIPFPRMSSRRLVQGNQP
jgi:hypothetical protein